MSRIRRIPAAVVANSGQSFAVAQKVSERGLGYFDPRTLEITIHSEQPEFGKWIILVHEMIHLICEKLKQDGTIKREPSHDTITYLAGSLVPMMAHSGMLRGVNGEHERAFQEQVAAEATYQDGVSPPLRDGRQELAGVILT